MTKDRHMDRHDRASIHDNESHDDDMGAHRPGGSGGIVFRLVATGNIFGPDTAGNDTLTGENNFAVGNGAGLSLTTGNDNILIGNDAGTTLTDGTGNTILGDRAGLRIASGALRNIVIGDVAGADLDGDRNVLIGNNAANDLIGDKNVCLGQFAGDDLVGDNNTTIGEFCGQNLVGTRNMIFGHFAGQDLVGNDNFCAGNFTGGDIIGNDNIAIGDNSLTAISITDVNDNIAIGQRTLDSLIDGDYNLALGERAGDSLRNADDNVILGHDGGENLRDSNRCICLGYNAGPITPNTDLDDQLFIDTVQTDAPTIHADFPTNTVTINGDLNITGGLTKGAGAFKIEHPKDSTKYLLHGFVEAPGYKVQYEGSAKLTGGKVTVDIDKESGMMPGTFVALARNPIVLLQNQSGFDAVKPIDINGGKFTIITRHEDCEDVIAWQVTAERKDKFVMESDSTDENGSLILEPKKGDRNARNKIDRGRANGSGEAPERDPEHIRAGAKARAIKRARDKRRKLDMEGNIFGKRKWQEPAKEAARS